ncbi:MAG TPA: RICIN domain-containing protein [Methylocella sp.]|nr:RICIN domain-containing protein [Methylocella sp.]
MEYPAVLFLIGDILIGAGLAMLFFKPAANGKSSLKMLGIEFESHTPGVAISFLGGVLAVVALVKHEMGPANPGSGSAPPEPAVKRSSGTRPPSAAPLDGHEIRLAWSAKCLAADAKSISEDGVHVQLHDCSDGPGQRWIVKPQDSNVTIIHAQSHRCLDAELETIEADGTVVQLWECTGRLNQQWNWPGFAAGTGPSSSAIQNRHSSLCLDAERKSGGPLTGKIQLWECKGTENQRWRALRSP